MKWVININELLLRREKERSIEYRILKNWYISKKDDFNLNEKGRLIIGKEEKKKYKRYKKLGYLYNKGKLQH